MFTRGHGRNQLDCEVIMKALNITIDGVKVECPPGATILEAAEKAGSAAGRHLADTR